MIKESIKFLTLSFGLTFFAALAVIPVLRMLKAGQPILKYVETHKNKSGTPTMGGLFFIMPAIAAFYILGGNGAVSFVSVLIGAAFMAVGFLDDFIKIKMSRNEGLKVYQKIILQTAIALFTGLYAYFNGITVFNVPFSYKTVDLGLFTVPIVALVFVAITNSVNLSDGLDGLCGSTTSAYLFFIGLLIYLQITVNRRVYYSVTEYENVIKLSFSLLGAVSAFLIFNVNKARVFMGDTGSLSLGGFIGAISVFTSNTFFIPVIGIMFVVSSISVIVQVAVYKKKKKRVFLMAPLHHHLQLSGCTETQISYYYFIITCIFGLMSVIIYL